LGFQQLLGTRLMHGVDSMSRRDFDFGTAGPYIREFLKTKLTPVGMISARGLKIMNSSPMTRLDLSREG
jgi:hypothetical protein